MKSFRVALWGMVAVFAAILGFLTLSTMQTVELRGPQIGGPFTLASAKGGVVNSEDLKGMPYGVFFGFTSCPVVCPTTLMEMTNVYEKLGNKGKEFRLYFITVDPEHDTAEFLKNYLENFHDSIEGLVPTPEELKVVAAQFRAHYEKVPTSDGGYTMNHTASVFLFDRKGQFAGTLAFEEAEVMRVGKVERLLSE